MQIDPSLMGDEAEIVEDLIKAAHNEARKNLEAAMAKGDGIRDRRLCRHAAARYENGVLGPPIKAQAQISSKAVRL